MAEFIDRNYRDMQIKKIKYNRKSVFYQTSGDGACVLFLHGFGEDGTIWDEFAEKISGKFKLIIPDIPGSGKSEMLPSEIGPLQNVPGSQHLTDKVIQHPTIEDFAEVITAILDEEAVKECVLIGHSMGGYIALAFAEKHPEKLLALGLFHSSAFADDEQKIDARLKAIEFIRTNGAHAFLKTSIPNLFADSYKQKNPGRIDALIEAGKNFSSEALIQYYYAMINRPDRIRVLETFPKPVLFIIGEGDTAIPLKNSLLQCHLPGISYVHILPEVGHMGMIENSNTPDLVSSFLNQTISTK